MAHMLSDLGKVLNLCVGIEESHVPDIFLTNEKLKEVANDVSA
jgi:hypothetical protein